MRGAAVNLAAAEMSDSLYLNRRSAGLPIEAFRIAAGHRSPRATNLVARMAEHSSQWVVDAYGIHMPCDHRSGGSMTEIVFVVQHSVDGGYEASAVGASLFTEAESEALLHEQVRDAVRCHFDEADRPSVIRLHFVRDEVIAV